GRFVADGVGVLPFRVDIARGEHGAGFRVFRQPVLELVVAGTRGRNQPLGARVPRLIPLLGGKLAPLSIEEGGPRDLWQPRVGAGRGPWCRCLAGTRRRALCRAGARRWSLGARALSLGPNSLLFCGLLRGPQRAACAAAGAALSGG